MLPHGDAGPGASAIMPPSQRCATKAGIHLAMAAPLFGKPRFFTVVAGTAEGETHLNAFDNALLAAGVGNMNLVKISSILPPDAEQSPRFEAVPGSFIPTAFGWAHSEEPGEVISAAIAIGRAAHDEYGVIMEMSGHCTGREAEATIRKMVEDAFRMRERHLDEILVKVAEHRVVTCGAAFAAVVLWG